MLSAQLGTIHNLAYYQKLMKDIRTSIENQKFDEFVSVFYQKRGMSVPDFDKHKS